jgi:hypothetical protein
VKNLLIAGVVGCSVMLTSCSTYETKIGNDVREREGLPPQTGHVFTGVVSAAAGVCFVKAPWIKEPKAFILAPLWVILVLIDTPLSLLADILMLPVDLLVTPKSPRTTFAQYCAYHAQEWKNAP